MGSEDSVIQKINRRIQHRLTSIANRIRVIVIKPLNAVRRGFSNFLVNQLAPRLYRSRTRIEFPKREKPHILLLRYKYYAQNKAMGDSTEKFMLDGTLAASDLATFEVLTYDADLDRAPRGNMQFLERCDHIQADAVLLSSWWYEPHPPPDLGALRSLKQNWRIPLMAIWWDTCWKDFWKEVQPVLPWVDLNIVPDNPNLALMDKTSPYFKRFLPLWVPLDPGIYKNDGLKRDIPISFLGQVGGYRSDRKEYIQALIDQQLPIRLSTVERDKQPSHAEYVDVLKRSRIGINFSSSIDAHQLKARVFETMQCGAMLMESENEQTSRYFTPMQDYVSFSSKEDLVGKLRYYLAHEDECKNIAARGEQKVRDRYNHIKFWQAVLEKLTTISPDAVEKNA